jgi:multisubunit Na+/H+ antiporter MnhB subunit
MVRPQHTTPLPSLLLQIRQQDNTNDTRIMPYGVTVGTLAIIFIIIEIVFIAQRKLLPSTMMLLSFILLVLFIAGIIGTAIQLFAGPNINNQCNTYVFNDNASGPNTDTLAFLQQRNICTYLEVRL